MAKKKESEAKKEAPKKVVKDFSKVTQSTKSVFFQYSKDLKAKKSGDVVIVSENVAEILELKGLGKKVNK